MKKLIEFTRSLKRSLVVRLIKKYYLDILLLILPLTISLIGFFLLLLLAVFGR